MKVSVFTKREIHIVIFFLVTQILNEYDPKIVDFKATRRRFTGRRSMNLFIYWKSSIVLNFMHFGKRTYKI